MDFAPDYSAGQKEEAIMQQRVKQGAFYRIPKELFTEWRFRDLSAESKLMFGILFDRYSLSMMNNWKDEYGETFEYSYAMKSLFREIGNQMSGTGNHHLLSASLLAHVFV